MRIAVLSDIHANLPALDAVLAAVGSVDAIWHLGDVVGYGPDPDGVVERLRGAGATGVKGNHDAAAVGEPGIEFFNPDARRAMEWTRTSVSPGTVAWLRALPETLRQGDVTLVHGSPREPIWEYVTSVPVARASLDLLATRIGLHGHTHIPAAFLEEDGRIEVLSPSDGSELELRGRRALVNPGSVGQPRDGDPRSSFLVLDTDADTVRWRRTEYDVAAVQAAMRSAGLPPSLAARLGLGL
ncbi:MAG TPA: metallophosphoesterase family protein [Candidatus Sulfomarinibacteraceae bacterium]|nr:metallophosphoesterase family protein [Candidatus Sulfomarinibacteraceae bacterium]